jgi:hypothetical protein
MELIKFRDQCVISRARVGQDGKPVRDEWDNPLAPEVVYTGPCLYEEGGMSSALSMVTRFPTLYLPGAFPGVKINDSVDIETEFGRELQSVVKIVRDVNMPLYSGTKITRIELKQAQGE